MRRGLVAAVLVLGSLVLPPVPSPAQEASAPSLAVWPRTGLVDDQELRIVLRDWPDRSWLAAFICHAEDNAYRWDSRCDLIGELDPGPRGGARIRRAADVIIDGPEPVDCRVSPCEVQVMDPNTSEDPGQILLRLPVSFDPAGPDPTRPPTEATPTTGLRAGDVVDVTGNGYPLRVDRPTEAAVERGEQPEVEGDDGPARPISLYQCRATATSYHGCDRRHEVVGMTPEGDFEGSVTVQSRLYLYDGGSVDCRVDACTIVATSNFQHSEAGVVPLAFDPTGPAPPAPQVTVTPGGPLQNGEQVTITAEHFPPRAGVQLAQCPPEPFGPYYFFSCHDVFGLWRVDAQGHGTFTHRAHSRLNPSTGPAVDCTTVTCRFVVSWAEVAEAPGAPLEFADDVSGAPRRITANRVRGLRDGQTITVRGHDYDAEGLLNLRQCVVGRVDFAIFRCDNRARVTVDPDVQPSFTKRYAVRRVIIAGFSRVNCARRQCYLATIGDENGFVRGPRITFAP